MTCLELTVPRNLNKRYIITGLIRQPYQGTHGLVTDIPAKDTGG